ncbi:peroxide stress protein YaaA [Aquabacterium sp.]|uniref:peroxide stress protein YaaA n=1 Tax=Aquabacterium sp. TaxID=1872578 RepID=UPI002C00FF3A|nr:peroxide stress protein YaaA [Aquabacterium sp.]HSW09218.1 peroxide stress protein YaaA [Aquabacterium sp.]
MLYLLSPAKTLDYQTPVPLALRRKATEPLFTDRAALLIDRLRELEPADVAALMDLSQELAALNVARYGLWSPEATERNSRPAAWAFDGDVYDGLSARTLKTTDWNWAQQHLVILSGLYGALRPLDRLQPYRLEMGTRLATPQAKDLYGYWGEAIAAHLNERLQSDKAPVVVNLASQEYFGAVDRRRLQARVIDCVFEDWKNGEYKIISFFAKRARGMLARWAIRERVSGVRKLQHFAEDGYAYDAAVSAPDRLVFRRRPA